MKILLALLTGFLIWCVIATAVNMKEINDELKKDQKKRGK